MFEYEERTEDRSCHEVEWSENILCGGRHLIQVAAARYTAT